MKRIIDPEREDAVRLDHPFDDLRLLELGVLVVHLFDGFEDFLHGLEILFLKRVLGLELRHDVLCSHDRCLSFVFNYEVMVMCAIKHTNVKNKKIFPNRY